MSDCNDRQSPSLYSMGPASRSLLGRVAPAAGQPGVYRPAADNLRGGDPRVRRPERGRCVDAKTAGPARLRPALLVAHPYRLHPAGMALPHAPTVASFTQTAVGNGRRVHPAGFVPAIAVSIAEHLAARRYRAGPVGHRA